jgi:hypothetical protein
MRSDSGRTLRPPASALVHFNYARVGPILIRLVVVGLKPKMLLHPDSRSDAGRIARGLGIVASTKVANV